MSAEGYSPATVPIYGPPGTGRTLTTCQLCRAFTAREDAVAAEYVNLEMCRALVSAANGIVVELAAK